MLMNSIQPSNARVHLLPRPPEGEGGWATLIQRLDGANVAQSPQWYTVIQRAYGHTPLYLQAADDEGQLGILPAFLIRSRLFGTVATSMPFLDGGGPCSASPTLRRTLLVSLKEEAARRGASVVEVRSTLPVELPVPASTDKVNLVLPLPKDPEVLWRQLDAKVRNQIRKAERAGLTVEVGCAERLDEFYAIFVQNMRDLGSPVHARGFFQAVLETFGEQARIVLVRKGDQPIGGLLALTFKDAVLVPWASSLRQYLALCPNMLLYWETLRGACREGFQRFEFGRSSRHSGTYRFKRQWGAQEAPLYRYTIPLAARTRPQLSSADATGEFLARLWGYLPVPVTRWLGPRVRKFLTQ